MPALDLALFTGAHDEESTRYRVLHGLQEARRAFGENAVYPHLADLIHLHEAMQEVADGSDALRGRGQITGIDLNQGTLRYEPMDEPAFLFETLIAWASPLVEEVIEEGRAIFDFVDEHTEVEAVGIVPSYQDEGYLLVPDSGVVRILRYAVSIFTRHDERFRSLRTAAVGTASADAQAHDLKQRLVAEHPDLPAPATYRLATDLDFPVEATILPVAKRKLLQYLAFGGSAGTC
ncbi:MAG: hypothetical protein AAGI91_08600 [Bacteroidota bacterium]